MEQSAKLEELKQRERTEKDVLAYSRMVAVRSVLVDNISQENTAKFLRKSPSWVSKWVSRFEEVGIDGLYDLPRTGRPPKADPKKVKKIIDYTCKEKSSPEIVQEEIREKLGVSYHVLHVRRLMRQYKYSKKKPTRFHINRALLQEQESWKRHMKYLISRLEPMGYAIVYLDEMFFTWSDAGGASMWCKIGQRHYSSWNGSRKRRCVYGAISNDGIQLFRQHEKFDSKQFVKFLDDIYTKFGKVLVVMDKATPHTSSAVEQYLMDNPDVRIEYFPTGCPEYNPVEACWRFTKNMIYSNLYGTFDDLCFDVSEYLRTRRFTNIEPIRHVFRKPILFTNF